MPGTFDPQHYAMLGKIGGHTRAATGDMAAMGRGGQAGLVRKFFNETDPTLPEDERWRRAEHLRKAHMHRISFLGAQARRKGAQ